MKCFERLVIAHINTIIPETIDPLQFAYCTNRSTDDAISIALHTALFHIDKTTLRQNNLSLNVIKTNEMIVDYRKKRTEHTPILMGATGLQWSRLRDSSSWVSTSPTN